MKLSKLSSALAAALLAAVPAVASANHVDFFEDGAFSLSTNTTGTAATQTQTGLPTGTVLGGQRDISLSKTGGGSGTTIAASLTEGTGGNADDNDVNVAFIGQGNARGVLRLSFGLGGDLNVNFLDIPGSVNDWDRVRVSFGAGTSANTGVTVGLFSRENGPATFYSLSQTFGGGLGNVDFLYSSFNGGAGLSDAFLRNVDQAFVAVSGGQNNFNVNLTSFNRNGSVAPAQVPEPSTLLLFGAALAGLVAVGRRKAG